MMDRKAAHLRLLGLLQRVAECDDAGTDEVATALMAAIHSLAVRDDDVFTVEEQAQVVLAWLVRDAVHFAAEGIEEFSAELAMRLRELTGLSPSSEMESADWWGRDSKWLRGWN